ncbi:hypothetical protein Godav_028050 [Gossypium davidsonii]|uniref:Uncharacterized protein n=2 Tax=Gossypium TaxID=3633 RepID=A0A7J8RZJ6_GOSDV|nr:hypothetical protein [Gossypium davidsonii]
MIPKLPVLLNFAKTFVSTKSNTIVYRSNILHCFFNSKCCVIFGCERLTEVQGIFKLEPIENFEAEEIKRLFNVGSIDRNQAQVYNFLTDRTMLYTPQVLQECRITSTFVVGSEVPIGFKHCINEHQISFSLPPPSHPEEKIHYFNFCIVFSILSDQIMEFAPSARIFNETKRIMWNHRSCFMGIPKTKDNTLLWLIHWPAMDFQLEGGDLVSCMVVPVHLTIRNFGISYIFEDNIRYQYDYTRSFPGDEGATSKMDMDLINKGQLSLGSSENVKVEIFNYLEESKVVASPQVLYDNDIITTIDPMPFDYFGHCFGLEAGKS